MGVARHLEARGPIRDLEAFTDAYYVLITNSDYMVSVSRSTADDERVKHRLDLTTKAFRDIN